MKKVFALILALVMLLTLCACGGKETAKQETAGENPTVGNVSSEENEEKDYSDYTIRIYSNSNSTERTTWLINEAADAGFTISIDDNSVISGDSAAVQAANENKDGDLLFGLNETRWSQIVKGQYENLSLIDWTPSWADQVGAYVYPGQAYGLVVQGALLLYRDDEYGTNGEELHFDHWADMINAGYPWYRQNKISGSTNTGINNSILYAYVDPASEAGGVSVEGWKTLWNYCAGGITSADDTYKYGFEPLNKGDVAISSYYTSALYGQIDVGAESSEHPLLGTMEPENWDVVDVKDGVFYIAEYIGILDKAGRSEEETEAVKAFAEWFGSAEVQAAWGEEFDTFPCNEVASDILYPDGKPAIYALNNMSLTTVEGTDMTYAEYAAEHNAEWVNIMTNLGFYWTDTSNTVAEPDWDNLDWATLTQAAG